MSYPFGGNPNPTWNELLEVLATNGVSLVKSTRRCFVNKETGEKLPSRTLQKTGVTPLGVTPPASGNEPVSSHNAWKICNHFGIDASIFGLTAGWPGVMEDQLMGGGQQ
jgi:hypothetical protein